MRYPASEKLEIIRLVEESPCRCGGRWKRLAFPATFYRWYDLYQAGESPGRPTSQTRCGSSARPFAQTSPQSVARSIKKITLSCCRSLSRKSVSESGVSNLLVRASCAMISIGD